MNRRHKFTLVELLVVIGIIGILAGLVFGAVSASQASGRNTQAKTDIASIIMALRGVENTYGKMVNKGTTSFNGQSVSPAKSQNENDTWVITGDTYDAFIAELSVPKNSGLTSLNINKRKVVFLEPKSEFDPSASYSTEKQKTKLWRDPWGNPYKVYINVEGEKYLKIGSKTIAADVAVYSSGPNGTDDNGCNADLDTCEQGSDAATHKLHDDVASWRK